MSKMEMPERIAALPRDEKGRPVPWFVHWEDGIPDFRVIEAGKIVTAVRDGRCWVCGQKLGRCLAFVIGPMCAVNRVSSEPPSHRDCAVFSAQACPFLSTPRMHRNEKDLPPENAYRKGAGIPLDRNPGVALVWMTLSFKPFKTEGGVLFDLGPPLETLWYCQGRPATRAEIMHSIETGLPALLELANVDGPEAVKDLELKTNKALELVPK